MWHVGFKQTQQFNKSHVEQMRHVPERDGVTTNGTLPLRLIDNSILSSSCSCSELLSVSE